MRARFPRTADPSLPAPASRRGGRDDLVTAVASARIQEIIQALNPIVTKPISFAEAMVEITVRAVNLTRSDPELRNLFETTPNLSLHEMLVGPNPVIHDLALAFYAPVFAAARASGELRDDADDDELVDWIRGVYLMMILRQDLDPDRERSMIGKFFLPSLLAPATNEARVRKSGTRRR